MRPASSTALRVSTCVQTCDSRAVMAAELAAQAAGEVVTDPDPLGIPSPWRTYRACLERTPDWATHRLVLQDDVLLCPRFPKAATAAIAARPDALVSFFAQGVPDFEAAFEHACRQGERWCVLDTVRWAPAVALAWPAALIHRFLAWAGERERQYPRAYVADDERIGAWANEQAVTVWATVPCLVQHPDDVPSTLGTRALAGRDRGRVAMLYAGDLADCDPGEVDWTR